MVRYILLDPQGGEGGGAPPTPVDPNEGFKALLAKYNNDALVVAGKLHEENYKLRQKNAAMKATVPDEGAVVLKGDDAKDWQKYREFGKPSEVKASLESGRSATTKLEGIGRAESYRKAARTLDLNEAVFILAAEKDGLVVEFVEDKGEDNKVVATAVVKGEGDSTTPLDEYVDKHWSDIRPALGGEKKVAKDQGGTPHRRPFGIPDPAGDSRDGSQQTLIRSGIYAAGL